VARLRIDRIALETCPRSNVLTRAVNDLTAHPVDRLLRAGRASP
jgi:adenosine deaminase